jgi:hypothetical protein
MARPTGFIAAAAILGLTVSAASAQTPGLKPVLSTVPQFQQAKLSVGGIRGTVLDDHGAPVSDALVSALSPLSSRVVTTDAYGHFRFEALPSGQYVLRIHRNGFMSTRRDGVRVSATGATADVEAIHLRRDATTPAARPILAAGMDAPSGGDTTSTDGDNHTETAWRLRHIKRGILKQDGDVVNVADAAAAEPLPSPAGSLFGRAFDGAASFLTATPFSGEVNLLTTSALREGSIVPLDFMPHGVAYLSIGAPAASGRWDVRASLSQSDLSAWILAGSYTSRDTPRTRTLRHLVRDAAVPEPARAPAAPALAGAPSRTTRAASANWRRRPLDDFAAHRRRLFRPLRATTIDRSVAVQPARGLHRHAVRRHASERARRPAHARAGRRGVRRAGHRRAVAAARADVRGRARRTSARRADPNVRHRP